MIDAFHLVLHRFGVCIPFGLMLGTLLAPLRLSGADFRQWFRDPGQPMAHADDSWIGLALSDIRTMSLAGLLLIAGVAAAASWRDMLESWPYAIGFAVGFTLAQATAEWAWRAGLALVPDAAPVARQLAATPMVPLRARERAGKRRIVICCDGTWNWPDGKHETNVVRFIRALAPLARLDDGNVVPQIAHYHLGVGTGNVLDRLIGGSIGAGLSSSVKSCYGFIVDNYAPGDEIFLFGFSRGAYVARSVAGMVGAVGVLQRGEMEYFIDAWDWYTTEHRHRRAGHLESIAPARHRDVGIECIGVWDTVGALGIPGTRACAKAFAFHDTALGPAVRHAFQALAMDERRGNFQASVWAPNPKPCDGQLLEQVWFPGVHSNIGGGYTRHGLSDTAMMWMLSRIRRHDLLAIDVDYVDAMRDEHERYPAGKLENSRAGKWSVIGSPVPRPVGITSETERIHHSAFARAAADVATPRTDVYRSVRRRAWLTAHDGLRWERDDFELAHTGDRPAGATKRAPLRASSKLGICDRVLRLVIGPA